MSMPTHIDLFSGIGGFALAAAWAGYETVGFCEIDGYCQKVLTKNFPGVPIHDDIRTLEAERVGQWVAQAHARLGNEGSAAADAALMQRTPVERVQPDGIADESRTHAIDLLTGGFPCQPFSVAGKRGGTGDDRYLWPEMRRVIDEVRPRFVLAENVTGLIKMALDDCLSDLEALGYACGAVVIPACAVGAWHRRDRVWIVAADAGCAGQPTGGLRGGNAPQREVLDVGTPDRRHGALADTQDGGPRCRTASWQGGLAPLLGEGVVADASGVGKREPADQTDALATRRETRDEPGDGGRDVADAECFGRAGVADASTRNDPDRNHPGWQEEARRAEQRGKAVADDTDGGRHGAPDGSVPPWRYGALDASWWEAESRLRGVPDGLSAGMDRHRVSRLKALGNAIVPQVAYELIAALAPRAEVASR